MEYATVNCGAAAQTNPCPLKGAEGLTLNQVAPLQYGLSATPSSPTSSPHGPNVGNIMIGVIVFLLICLTLLADYVERIRPMRERRRREVRRTVVIRLQNLTRGGSPLLDENPAGASQEEDEARDAIRDPVRNLEGLLWPPRAVLNPRAPHTWVARPGMRLHIAASEETLREEGSLIQPVRWVPSEETLRGPEITDRELDAEGGELAVESDDFGRSHARNSDMGRV